MASHWRGHDRGESLPSNWSELRRLAKAAAGGQCQCVEDHGTHDGSACWVPGTDCDHRGDRRDHSLANLQWLCGPCHDWKTIRDREARRGRSARPAARHPGLA